MTESAANSGAWHLTVTPYVAHRQKAEALPVPVQNDIHCLVARNTDLLREVVHRRATIEPEGRRPCC